MSETQTDQIRTLNDAFRTKLEGRGQLLITPGIQALGDQAVMAAIGEVQAFSDFSKDNDPYGEHDFGTFDLNGEKVFWKIDLYDNTLTAGSPDPANPAVTMRVLTILLASEY